MGARGACTRRRSAAHELAAYDFRNGLAALTPELLARRYGAWAELERQLRVEVEPE